MPDRIKLYGGKYELEMNDDHVYSLWIDGELHGVVPNVTSVTDCLDFGKSSSLCYWAINCGFKWSDSNWSQSYDDIPSSFFEDKYRKDFKYAHVKEKKRAAEIGKIVHDYISKYIEQRILGAEYGTYTGVLPSDPEARRAIHQFKAFDSQMSNNPSFRWIESEKKCLGTIPVFYCGTFDAIYELDGGRYLIDFKTSNSFRKEYWLQTSAYLAALNEENLATGQGEILGRSVLMLPKDGESYEHLYDSGNEISHEVDVFRAALIVSLWGKKKKPSKKKVKDEH